MKKSTIDPFFSRAAISLFLIGLCFALYKMSAVLVPFAVAFILAYLLNPIVVHLQKYIKRVWAILLVYLIIIAWVVIFFVWAVPLLWEQLKIFWEYLPVAVDWYNSTARAWVSKNTEYELLAVDAKLIEAHILNHLQTNYQVSDVQSIALRLLSSGLSVVNTAGLFVLIPIISFYFLLDWQTRLQTWANAIPNTYRTKALIIAKDCDKAMMSFIKGQFTVMILLGMTYAVQLRLIGLELGIIIGMTAGIASFVPYLGFGVGIGAALIAGLLQFGLDWVHLSLIISAFMVGQVLESYVLQPLLLGDKIGLSPIWVMFAVLAGASLFGFVGMLIALPVSAIINVICQHAFDAYINSEYYKGQRQYKLF